MTPQITQPVPSTSGLSARQKLESIGRAIQDVEDELLEARDRLGAQVAETLESSGSTSHDALVPLQAELESLRAAQARLACQAVEERLAVEQAELRERQAAAEAKYRAALDAAVAVDRAMADLGVAWAKFWAAGGGWMIGGDVTTVTRGALAHFAWPFMHQAIQVPRPQGKTCKQPLANFVRMPEVDQ